MIYFKKFNCTHFLLLALLAMGMFCSLQKKFTGQPKNWTVAGHTENTVTCHYLINEKQALEIFKKQKPDCVAKGWILCDYIKKAVVIFHRNGTLTYTNLKRSGDADVSIQEPITWKVNNSIGKINLSMNGFLVEPDKSMLQDLLDK